MHKLRAGCPLQCQHSSASSLEKLWEAKPSWWAAHIPGPQPPNLFST